MKLYDAAWAPSPRRVRIYLAEKGIEIERVPIDLRADEQFSDAYLAVNPRGAVPALELDDGEVITEFASCTKVNSCPSYDGFSTSTRLRPRCPSERSGFVRVTTMSTPALPANVHHVFAPLSSQPSAVRVPCSVRPATSEP